jgi:pilus assembly protein HofP
MADKQIAVLLIAFLPVLMGMRDPFAPPIDRCQTQQLARWHYQGSVGHAQRRIGLLKDGEGKWHRVEPGASFDTGWRLVAISEKEITVGTGEGCDPDRWTWIKEGEKHENLDKPVVLPAGTAGAGGKKRLAGSR